MNSEWLEVTLAEVSSAVSYGYTASAKLRPIGPKFLRITDIRHGFIDWSSVPYCEIRPPDHEKYRLRVGDICVARTGASTGTSVIIRQEVDAVFASYLVRFRINPSMAEASFVALVLGSQQYDQYIASIIGGSAQPNSNASQLGEFRFALPPLPTQRRIAEILGRLDDKIEVNRRINRTLEAMAQALYRHWFVDFGPFQEGEFVESAVGLVPRGWEVKALDEIATYTNGLALQKYPPKGDAYLPVIKIAEMRRGVTESSDKASPDIDARYIVQDGDVLFSWSGTLLVTLWCGGPGALNQHLFKVTSAQYPKWLYYWATKHHLDEFKQIAANKVTTMGHIQRHHLAEALVAIPPAPEFQRIDRTMSLLLDKIIECELESRQLAAARDYLQPRLLAGEVEV